ncbi:hypothetical protein [Dankookia sp. P2]
MASDAAGTISTAAQDTARPQVPKRVVAATVAGNALDSTIS